MKRSSPDGWIRAGGFEFQDVARELGVSATPVANALKRLEVEGYVSIEHRRGFRIVPLSVETLEELVVLRVAAESFAVGLAAPRLTPKDFQILRAINTRIDSYVASAQTERGVVALDEDFFMLDQEFHVALYRASGRGGLVETIIGLRDRCRAYIHLAAAGLEHVHTAQEHHLRLIELLERGDAEGAQRVIEEHITRTLDVLREPLLRAHKRA